MIQIITYDTNKYNEYSDKLYKISELGEIQALDDFEICIIDLSAKGLWQYKNGNPNNINSCNDLLTLKEAILNRKKSKILIVLPQNVTFYYSYTYHYNNGYKFDDSIQIKDNKDNVIQIVSKHLYELGNLKISYERTTTQIDDDIIDADFNFINVENGRFEPITFSSNSNKITTIQDEDVFITTLDLNKGEEIIKHFIERYCKDKDKKESRPKWVYNITFFNDEQLNQDKGNNLKQINELKQINAKIDRELEKNLEYKSILYTNGDELVQVVMSILDELLDYDSSEFVDEKREDFLVKKEDITFIGEIKGVSSAIANKNVSQLDVHVQSYLDNLQEERKEEKVKGLLIINHQRNKPIEERQEVHEHQVNLAKRNGSLIIETQTLLRIFEKYKLGKITEEECKKLFEDNVGLLEI